MTKPKDQNALEESQGHQEPEEGGRANCSQGDLTLEELTVRFAPDRLGDHLPVFGSPDEIIRINRDHPEYLDARRVDDTGSSVSVDGSSRKT